MRVIPWHNGWTGGQYSVFRAVFGLYLLVHFVHLLPWAPELFSDRGVLPDASASPLAYLFPNVLAWYDPPWFAIALLALAAALSVLLAVGWRDRAAAAGLWYVWACLIGRNPLIMNPGLPYVGWMLLAHAFLPPAPHGSLAARGRVDPGGGWRMTPAIFAIAWLLMAAGYTYSGLTKLASPSWVDGTALAKVLDNPLARPGVVRDLLLAMPPAVLRAGSYAALAFEIAFLPLILVPRLRPWVWAAMLAMHLSLILVIDFADLSLGMVMLHFFTFNPAWVPPKCKAATEAIYYDGHCGLCHRWVRFVVAEDTTGHAFVFAPLEGETMRQAVPEAQRRALPDSVVVQTAHGRLLARSAAVRHILARLGGLWRVASWLLAATPTVLLNAGYDAVARVRHRLFAAPADACPLLPPELRVRFRA